MQYAILCYHDEKATSAWSKERDAAVMAKLRTVTQRLATAGKLLPVARLLPTTAATTLRKDREPPLVIDGPFAETKEQLLGFYIIDCADLAEALGIAKELGKANPGGYRDDILRLLFVCAHPDLPVTQQIALALRIVCGLPVATIARAFLASDAAIEQRITRAKARVAAAGVPFEAPGAAERMSRVAAVMAMLYLLFNEGYTTDSAAAGDRAPLALEAIRLARLLLGLFPAEPEVMGLAALMLLQQSRAAARFDTQGEPVLLDDQDRSRWDGRLITEGLALIDKAVRHGRPGPYQVQAAIAALHARATRASDTDWPQLELLYGTLERMEPSPVVTLNRAVAVAKTRGPAAALDLVEPLAAKLDGYFYFHGACGMFLKQLGRLEEGREAFNRAIALATTPAEAAHIRREIDRLEAEPRAH